MEMYSRYYNYAKIWFKSIKICTTCYLYLLFFSKFLVQFGSCDQKVEQRHGRYKKKIQTALLEMKTTLYWKWKIQ